MAHRIRRDDFRASTVSVFVKYKDFSVSQKQGTIDQPSDVTAVILNEARSLLSDAWDGVTPIRQVGLGVSKLTHESSVQMSLFEDPKMEYYREWDRQFDEQRSRYEDAKMLAYERKGPYKKSPTSKKEEGVIVFHYPDGESALAAVKKAIKENRTLSFSRRTLEDGTDCFEVSEGGKVLERHCVKV